MNTNKQEKTYKIVGIKIPLQMYDRICKEAAVENRNMSNFILNAVIRYIENK